MATDFDEFPLYDELIKNKIFLSDVWRDFMSTFYQSLIGYLSQNGIFIPVLTTAQRNTLQSPVNGQMIYNSTANEFQGFKAGSWVTFTTV